MRHRPTIGFISTWPVYQGTTIDRYAHSLIQGISAAANEYVCKSVEIRPVASNLPAGVEVLQRSKGKSLFLFVLNHSNEKIIVPVDGDGCNLLTATDIHGSIELDPSGVAVIQMK